MHHEGVPITCVVDDGDCRPNPQDRGSTGHSWVVKQQGAQCSVKNLQTEDESEWGWRWGTLG
jgi:hypothetical protein